MEFFLNKWPRGQGQKIRWSDQKGGQTMCACAHSICLPSFLPADFKEEAAGAGRNQGRLHNHNIVRAPRSLPWNSLVKLHA